MSQSSYNMGALSLFASVAIHATVLATVPALIGETGNGPAESNSTLQVSIQRLEPSDDLPMENPEINLSEQHASPQRSDHLPDLFKERSVVTKSSDKHNPKPRPSLVSTNQPTSNNKGADIEEKRPRQVATSGHVSRLTRNYQSTLQRIIERYKYYPLQARRNGLEGTSTVAFKVSSNGSISGIALARSSGTALLDHAALQTIKRIGNAPPFPDDIKRSQLSFAIPIAYNLK